MPGAASSKDRNQNVQEFFVGVDVGGTNIKAGVVTSNGRPLSSIVLPTEAEKGPEQGLKTIRHAVTEAVEQSPIRLRNITAIGLATPGTLDIPNGILMEPANLPTWRHIPIRQLISDHFEKPTILQNDANAAAYGEFWGGAGRGAHTLALWTLGTGVGCGLIVDRKIVEGAHSHGGECGFLYLQIENGRPCATGMKGTLEAYAGAAGFVVRAQEALDAGGHSTLLRRLVDSGSELTPLLIADAATAGDPLALQLIDDTATFMAYGTANLMHTIDPDVVLFGGNVTFGRNETELGRRFVSRVRDEIKQLSFPVPASKIRIDYASLGGSAGFIGAAGCAWNQFGVEASACSRHHAS
ncbi:MAG: ROK family protein [Planctomycetota bacterium]|nr:ROK family protein [Planctomycetota bacterium]MDA1163755.1 ROK family protein [Planctomycetota bacterium]